MSNDSERLTMIEPGSGRTCMVFGRDREKYEKLGYRLASASPAAEPGPVLEPTAEAEPELEPTTPAPAVDVTPFVQPDRKSGVARRRRR